MKKAYGDIYYCAGFFDKLMSEAGRVSCDAVAAYHVASALLRKLDALQEENPLVTLSFATDSLRVYFRGQLQFHIQARKSRAIIWIPGAMSRELCKEIQAHPRLFPVENAHISWVLTEGAVKWLMKYLQIAWQPLSDQELTGSISHSRYIPGDIRQAALSEFFASGRWCPGVAGTIRRHKVTDDMRIEFDHILPHSMGGSNGYANVQVLCSSCNSAKKATAA